MTEREISKSTRLFTRDQPPQPIQLQLCTMASRKQKAPPTAPRTEIDIFLDKLPQKTLIQIIGSDTTAVVRRCTLVSDGGDALRYLKLKKIVLPKKGDGVLSRAGLVVEYLCRHARSSNTSISDSSSSYLRTTIPVQTLSQVLNVKSKKLIEQMQTVVERYLSESSIGKKSSSGVVGGGSKSGGLKRKSRDGTSSSASAANTSATTATKASSNTINPTNLINDLSIQLGPMISDAEFTVAYATKIFTTLANASSNSFKRSRHSKHQLMRNDILRNMEYYEAACFFFAVQKSEGGSGSNAKAKSGSKKSTSRKESKASLVTASTRDGSDAEEEKMEDDNDDDRSLTEMDVIRAVGLMERMFKDVLSIVKEWMQDDSITLDVATPSYGTAADKEAEEQGMKVTANKGTDENEDETAVPPRLLRSAKKEYESWKRHVLEDARRKARETHHGDEDVLSHAASAVLKKFGLLTNRIASNTN